jgi:hypothetical protein
MIIGKLKFTGYKGNLNGCFFYVKENCTVFH